MKKDTTTKNENILIVDDDQFVRQSIANLLKSWEFAPSQAANSAEALQQVKENVFLAILLDIRLGEENGLDLLKTLRGQKIETPVIVMTAYPSEYNRDHFFNYGAVAFLTKPVYSASLKEILGLLT